MLRRLALRVALRGLVSGWLVVLAASSLAQTPLPFPLKRDQVAPFALKLLADSENESQEDGIQAALPFGVRSSKASISPEEINFSGVDKSGQPWTVMLDNQHIGLGYKLYVGDLDKNGLADAVLVTYTGANGLLPTNVLSILTFDAQGRPLLWQAGQNVTAEKDGIAQLVDLDRDGKAELITEHFDDEGFAHAEGYVITDVYKLENSRWRRLSQLGEVALPVYARPETTPETIVESVWLIRPPEKLPADRQPFAPDLSNVAPVAEGKAELNKLVNATDETTELARPNDRCKPDDFILVEDSKLRRRISILSGSDEANLKPLLTQLKVKLYGNCSPGKLAPRLIWITK